ncbi:hypothetical protein OG592_44690 (plasmid) [Streptomyces avidinii]|uniref:hypothetical protein n=1 Tax=Streptomyces avidinii TaxID=1895 RepID=UPI002F91B4A7|nr:hypothetical protein OG592_44690 [Streptomyces avidinii]
MHHHCSQTSDLSPLARVSVATIAAAVVEQLGEGWSFSAAAFGTEACIMRGTDWEGDVSFELEPDDEGLILYSRLAGFAPHGFGEHDHTTVEDVAASILVSVRALIPQVEDGMRRLGTWPPDRTVRAAVGCQNPALRRR